MPLFFDTNVPIGYIFKWDPWHIYAKNAFESNDLKYWSNTVLEETHKKLIELKDDYSNFLHDIHHIIRNQEGFFNKDDIMSLADSSEVDLESKKKHLIIESIWDKEGFAYEENSRTISNSLDGIIMDFNSDIYHRKNKFSVNTLLHKRIKDYPKIKEELKKEIHYPDYEIFLDAHDLCFIHSNLEFVTSDYNERKIEYVKSQTSIPTITDLRKFVFK